MSTIEASPASATQIPEGARRLTVVGVPSVAERKPEWMKRHIPLAGPNYRELKKTMRGAALHTVCEEAACPNIHQCWEQREASFLIGGEDCTRRCGFCQISTGKPASYDTDEPRRVAETVAQMGLHFAVVTGVARDDLDDGGAWLYAETARQIHELVPNCGVELLIPDFSGSEDGLREVLSAEPEVLAHNLETVRRVFRHTRPAFRYDRSLEVLSRTREWAPHIARKSNLILGMGETEAEVYEAMDDLAEAGCQILTIGQYLQPTHKHLALQRFAEPAEYDRYREYGERLGFDHVEAGPLVRSSFMAGEQAVNAGAWSRPSGDQ
ncbi:lipoyl synthase [Euzebya tangerina]|uniref:lipoyl synthase n=1 Tax=Euzebya tangerina TaxID=591198 RepID=UPI000E30C39D|nr:lipoyl synthase [Euzebya tangerina]